jgi:hypothetical protein
LAVWSILTTQKNSLYYSPKNRARYLNPSLKNTINQIAPDYVPGLITLIPSLGVQQVNRILPQLIEVVKKNATPCYGVVLRCREILKLYVWGEELEQTMHVT